MSKVGAYSPTDPQVHTHVCPRVVSRLFKPIHRDADAGPRILRTKYSTLRSLLRCRGLLPRRITWFLDISYASDRGGLTFCALFCPLP